MNTPVLNIFMFLTVEVKSLPEGDYVTVLIRNYLPVLISHVIGTGPQCTANMVNNAGDEVRVTLNN